MEMLADRGNGNYAYLDTLAEARKVLVRFVHDGKRIQRVLIADDGEGMTAKQGHVSCFIHPQKVGFLDFGNFRKTDYSNQFKSLG